MADVQAFRPLTPPPARASRVASVPYDVVDAEEARALAAGNPDSFLHVTRPEIDMAPDADAHGPEAYLVARANLERLVAEGALVRENEPCVYLYRLTWQGQSQTGLVAGYSVEEYDRGLVKKHEFTRPDKEADRTDHMQALGAQPGPVFLAHRPDDAYSALADTVTAGAPWINFEGPDGVRHTIWRITESGPWSEAMGALEALYVADGHHRSAAASNLRRRRVDAGTLKANDPAERFLAVSFPADQLRILSYNRLIKDLGDHTPDSFVEALTGVGQVSVDAGAEPEGPFDARFYVGGRWVALRLDDAITDPVDSLAVEQVQQTVLGPLLGIGDPRTDARIAFVGGIRGTAELERRVDGGEAALGVSLPPVTAEQLLAVADAGRTMPPKSTWFEPKLRSGLFVYQI